MSARCSRALQKALRVNTDWQSFVAQSMLGDRYLQVITTLAVTLRSPVVGRCAKQTERHSPRLVGLNVLGRRITTEEPDNEKPHPSCFVVRALFPISACGGVCRLSGETDPQQLLLPCVRPRHAQNRSHPHWRGERSSRVVTGTLSLVGRYTQCMAKCTSPVRLASRTDKTLEVCRNG
jgi:hypothetical protein